MDRLEAFSVDYHTITAANLLRKALEGPEDNPFVNNRSQELARYTQKTFSIMVAVSSYRMQPVICTTMETFEEFLEDIGRIMKKTVNPKAFGVQWEAGNCLYDGSVTPENLHVVLRTMEMGSRKGFFQILGE